MKDQRPRTAFMSAQYTAGEGDIEQRAFYAALTRCLLKSKCDSIVVGIRILAQPFIDVLQNCCPIPIAITKSATAPCCYHFS
jgi:hypothetical protein